MTIQITDAGWKGWTGKVVMSQRSAVKRAKDRVGLMQVLGALLITLMVAGAAVALSLAPDAKKSARKRAGIVLKSSATAGKVTPDPEPTYNDFQAAVEAAVAQYDADVAAGVAAEAAMDRYTGTIETVSQRLADSLDGAVDIDAALDRFFKEMEVAIDSQVEAEVGSATGGLSQ
jgi:hypothetical protein